jgi:LPPG:FO 2-phospho-L-lactate transferase
MKRRASASQITFFQLSREEERISSPHESLVVLNGCLDMMITLLSGGRGTLRLLRGFRPLLNDSEIAVIANTSDNMWLSGNHVAPALDSTMFLFAGLLNTQRWRGIRGDTFSTHRFLEKMDRSECMAIGDKERAVQIARAELLQSGLDLTSATEILCGGFGIFATILPMTDAEVHAVVATSSGPMQVLEYETLQTQGVEVTGVTLQHEEALKPNKKVMDCINGSEAVIIGPENPFTSIYPVLACEGIREALADRFVLAISPFGGSVSLGDEVATFMSAGDLAPSSKGVYAMYEGIVDCFVQDINDPVDVEGAIRLDTRIAGRTRSESLAWDLQTLIRSAVQ